MIHNAAGTALVAKASALYRNGGRFGYYVARGKLRGDPAFAGILEQGLLRRSERILDLGCGQGLLAAWLDAAREYQADTDKWPANWPAAPQPRSMRGIELNGRAVRRARSALRASAEFVVGDIVEADYGVADAIVILDVLHYIDYRSQERVLARVRAALTTGGVLLLRVSDANAGIRFTIGKYVDQAVLLAQVRWPKLYCRSTRDWMNVLDAGGFEAQAMPMSAGTPFANTMLIAHPR